jgi:LacI family transcriptional regulator
MPIRICDVAKRAGVSTATVSHVLNGTRPTAEVTRTRVLEIVRELGYHPSAVARGLRTKSTGTLGVVLSDIRNPFFTALVRGIEDVAQANGLNLIVCNSDEDEAKAETYLRLLLAKRVEGLVFTPTGRANVLLEPFLAMGIPVILIDRVAPDLTLPFVGVDNVQGAREAVAHLLEDGHRRIGVVAGLPTVSTSTHRLEGYKLALADYGLAADSALIREGHSSVQGGEEATGDLLALAQRPTALFTTNNLMTLGALKACAQLRLRCPDDVALCGFDDHEWAEIFSPPLTVVRQPTYEIGTTAAQLLARAIRGEALPAETILLKTRLIIRASCRPGGHEGQLEEEAGNQKGRACGTARISTGEEQHLLRRPTGKKGHPRRP